MELAVAEVICFHSQASEPVILPDLSFLAGAPNLGYQLPASDPDLPANVIHGPEGDLQHFKWWSGVQDETLSATNEILSTAFKTADTGQVVDHETSIHILASTRDVVASMETAYALMNRTHQTESELLRLHRNTRLVRRVMRNVAADMESVLLLDADQSLDSSSFKASEMDVKTLKAPEVHVGEIGGLGRTDELLRTLDSYRIPVSQEGTIISGKKTIQPLLVVMDHVEYNDLNEGFNMEDVVKTKEAVNLSSDLDLTDAVVRTEDLTLVNSSLDEAIFIDTNRTIIPVQVEFDEIHIEKLTLHSGLLDSFPVGDAFLFTEGDQDVAGTLVFEDVKAKTMLPTTLNKRAPEEMYPDIFQLNEGEVYLTENVTRFSNITVMGDLNVNGTLDRITFPSEMMVTNQSQVISASLNMTNCTFEETITATGTVDSLFLPADVIQLTVPEEEETAARLYFKTGINSTFINTTGLLNGSDFDHLRQEFEQIQKENDVLQEIRSGSLDREVIINGNLSLADNRTVAGLDLSLFYEDVVMKMPSNESIELQGLKTFPSLATAFCNLTTVNDVDFDDIASNNTKQFSSLVMFENVAFASVSDKDDENSSLSMLQAVLQDYYIENNNMSDPVPQVTVAKIIVEKTVNDVHPLEITRKNGSSVISGDKKFVGNLTSSLLILGKDLVFTRSLDHLDSDFFDERIALDSERHLTEGDWNLLNSSALSVKGNRLRDGTDNMDITLFLDSIMRKTNDQDVNGRISFGNSSEAFGEIYSTGLFKHAIRRGLESPNRMSFEDDLIVEALEITGSVNEIDLSFLFQDVLKKNKNPDGSSQVVSSQETRFTAGIDSQRDVETWNVYGRSGHQMISREHFNVLLQSGDQTVREHLAFGANVTLRNVTFEDRVSFRIPTIPPIPDNLTDCAKTISFGNTTLVVQLGSNVTFAKNLNFNKFYGFDWSFFMNDIVMHNEDLLVPVRAKKKFTTKATFERHLDMDMATVDGRLAGFSVAQWDAVQTSDLHGLLSFMDDVHIEAAQFKSRVNDVSLKSLVDKRSARHVPAAKEPGKEDAVYRAPNMTIDAHLTIISSFNRLPVDASFRRLSSPVLSLSGDVSFGSGSSIQTLAIAGNLTTSCSLTCQLYSPAWAFVNDRLADIDHFTESHSGHGRGSGALMPCHEKWSTDLDPVRECH